jgi:hypothetical protein
LPSALISAGRLEACQHRREARQITEQITPVCRVAFGAAALLIRGRARVASRGRGCAGVQIVSDALRGQNHWL